jgi:hypothetical protein
VDRIDVGHLFRRLWLPKVTASETLQVSRDDDGFTLIDLLLVIVIVSLESSPSRWPPSSSATCAVPTRPPRALPNYADPLNPLPPLAP